MKRGIYLVAFIFFCFIPTCVTSYSIPQEPTFSFDYQEFENLSKEGKIGKLKEAIQQLKKELEVCIVKQKRFTRKADRLEHQDFSLSRRYRQKALRMEEKIAYLRRTLLDFQKSYKDLSQ